MNTGWDKFQEMIKDQMRQVYSETVIEHAMDPKNVGDMENPDVYVNVLGSCGDSMELWLKIKDDVIIDASFLTDGCSATIACGSMMTELTKNKTLGEALAISARVLIQKLGGLPPDHTHCAGLASLTLKRAIMEYMKISREPWKKAYQQTKVRQNPVIVDESEAQY